MKRAINFLLACLTIISVSQLSAAQPNDKQREELTALVNEWVRAEVETDRDGLAAILHKDFVSTFASGKTINKDQYLDFILGLDIPPFTVQNEVMFVHADTAVVVDVSGSTKFTWIARNENGTWLVIAQTFSQIKNNK